MNLLKYRGGLTQQEFADFLGLSQSFYNQLERGTKDPSLKTMRQIAERLGITAVSYTHLTLPTNREV